MNTQPVGKAEIIVWGIGHISREFICVEDATKGIVMAAKQYNRAEPLKIGDGFEAKTYFEEGINRSLFLI